MTNTDQTNPNNVSTVLVFAPAHSGFAAGISDSINSHCHSVKLLEYALVSLDGKALIFPWIPGWKIIELALKLNLRVYVGDWDLQQCEKIISKLGFDQEI